MLNERYRGAFPVLPTPFGADGSIDFGVYEILLEWYLAHRVGGFYANCSSSEMFALTPDERVALVHETVRVVDGRVPVVATGNFGADLSEQVASCASIADAGADAVVIRVPDFETTDDELTEYYLAFERNLTGPLGIYECPGPVRRLLPPELTRRLAESGRWVAMKETSGRLDAIEKQIAATNGTSLRLFQANTTYLPESVRWGAAGAMSVATNVAPELVDAVIQKANDEPSKCAEVHALLCEFDALAGRGGTLLVKHILAWRGVPVKPVSRRQRGPLAPELLREAEDTTKSLLERASEWLV
jgi:4-hydroxy-tetrahydrodipicolinate synthase